MDDRVVKSQETAYENRDGAASGQGATARSEAHGAVLAARIVSYITSVLLVLLGIRFVLALLGANTANAFANFIYAVTYPFVAPFFGLFGYKLEYGVSRFEIDTLVAMVVYALVGYGISRLLTIKQADH